MATMTETASRDRLPTSDLQADKLDPTSYTASRLKHAAPEHLHLTSRRFFIGPIPEGWLNSNRKAWYRRRLELSNYSSRQATFHAAENPGTHHRTVSGLVGPSVSTRMQFSFPQPEDADSVDAQDQEADGDSNEDADTEDEDEIVETTALAPVNTEDAALLGGPTDSNNADDQEQRNIPHREGLDGARDLDPVPSVRSNPQAESFKTAKEDQKSVPAVSTPRLEIGPSSHEDVDNRQSMSTQTAEGSFLHINGHNASADNIDNSSRTALLQAESPVVAPHDRHLESPQSMKKQVPQPMTSPQPNGETNPKSRGVRFKVAEGVADRQHRFGKRVDSARGRVTNRISRRETLRAGTIVKMERMLVRIDTTMQQLPNDFDENESLKTETRQLEKWREFMVVARRSQKGEEHDFRLQMYKTRVIPEIDDDSSKKKPAREVKLLPKTTHVNLYSSLDKTLVLWHPYKKGTRILLMRPSSTAHSVEWYTFLRDALGWHRPATLQVNVPDLDVSLHLDRPFQELATAGLEAVDEESAINKTVEAEKAVAGKIISQSMEMLSKDPEWSEVLKKWSETAQMGLAWKRYDRLEWVHGVNEQKMYGSMAMSHSYDLELRPKHHYPTTARGKKGVSHEEPAPIEGFLVRLTSQKGVHRRMGKAFFKRLYFATYDRFLVFNRPAKVTPPHPPRLATISGTNVPSSSEITDKSPIMYDVEPYRLQNDHIKWLNSNQRETVHQHDVDAVEEARRNVSNLTASDGYVDMCDIIKVRKLKWGATEADEGLESGSDVDFHVDVDNTTREDGVTGEIDDERTFELVLENDLIIRLQAYNKETRDEWMRRMKKLIKYWKLRTAADVRDLKAVRMSNLKQLNIDEEMEARIGQFARKWEVSRSDASPDLYNMCRLTSCRTITMAGMLYRKARRRATFHRCSVLLTGGQMLVFQDTLRKGTGAQIPHIHQEKQQIIDLRDCYIYSGLVVEDDLLYQNRTFDANYAGMLAPTPRIYREDGWTSADVDVMTCFVLWMNRRKGWFRSVTSAGADVNAQSGRETRDHAKGEKRSQLKRVAQLGVPGRGMVFKCRSRAERDLWVLAMAAEIEIAVEKELCEQGKTMEHGLADVRLEH